MLKESFLSYLRFERNYSDKTIRSYGIDLEKFEEYLKGVNEELALTDVDADLVRGWVLSLMEQGYATTSVNRKLSSLRSFYNYLLRRGMLSVDPMLVVKGPKNKKPLPVFVRDEETHGLLAPVTAQVWRLALWPGLAMARLVGRRALQPAFAALRARREARRAAKAAKTAAEKQKKSLPKEEHLLYNSNV